MKIFITGLLLLASLSALALPKDSEPAIAIDVGSTIKVDKDIIIPSFNKLLIKDGVEYRFFSEVASGPFCRLLASDNMWKPLSGDLLIKAGTTLKLISNSNNGRLVSLITETSEGDRVLFDCYISMIGANGTGVPSIKNVRDSMAGLLSLELASPEEM